MRRTSIIITLTLAAACGALCLRARAAASSSSAPARADGCEAYAPPVPAPTTARKIDEYGNLPWSDERARLDNFAVELRNDPTARAHIICYGGRRGLAGEARRMCERAAGYLIKRKGIEASRVFTVDGGYREELTVELWTPPAGSIAPTPSPTLNPSEVTVIRDAHGRRRARVRRL